MGVLYLCVCTDIRCVYTCADLWIQCGKGREARGGNLEKQESTRDIFGNHFEEVRMREIHEKRRERNWKITEKNQMKEGNWVQ